MVDEIYRKLAKIDEEIEDIFQRLQLAEHEVCLLQRELTRLQQERTKTCLILRDFQR